MSKRKKQNVPVAEAQKPSPDSVEAISQEPSQEAITPSMPFDISKISPEMLETAKNIGLPVEEIVKWAASVEMRFAIISKNLEDAPQKVVEALKAEALKRQNEMAQQMQQQPQQGGGGLGALGQLAPLLGALGGGGSNPLQDKMMEAMFEKTMMGMDLSNALTKAMIIKLAPELAGELTKALVKSA